MISFKTLLSKSILLFGRAGQKVGLGTSLWHSDLSKVGAGLWVQPSAEGEESENLGFSSQSCTPMGNGYFFLFSISKLTN